MLSKKKQYDHKHLTALLQCQSNSYKATAKQQPKKNIKLFLCHKELSNELSVLTYTLSAYIGITGSSPHLSHTLLIEVTEV